MEKVVKSIIYRVVKLLANVSLRFYFRGLDIVGKKNVPKNGPYIYAVNHQNAFLDAIIVGALSSTPTYFMTRSDVFKPPFDWFLDALKMMPIYRIRDGYKSLTKNDAIFDTCKNILANKQALLIFPEGNHGLDYYLRPLTKGLARISLQAQAQLEDDIKIIPVGLNYFDHFSSGHKLIINYGKPLRVQDYIDTYNDHKNKGLVSITKGISEGMQKTLVIPNDSDDYVEKKKIFQRSNENQSFKNLRTNINHSKYLEDQKHHKLLAHIGKFFGILNWPPIFLTKYIIRTKVSQKIFTGSIKIASVMLLFPIWFIFCFLLVWILVGIKWACILFISQVLTLLIRSELVRLNH